MFPIALTALGVGIVAGGIWWQRHVRVIQARFAYVLPATLRNLVAQ